MKITTDVCKRELDKRFPPQLGVNKGGWKRLSRKGFAKTSIVRVFQHRRLSVWATVVEESGEIVSVVYCTEPPKAGAEEAQVSQPSASKANRAPARNEHYSASDFYFAVVDHYEEGFVMVALCPVDFWNRNKHMSDSVSQGKLVGLLPEGFEECMEGCFEAATSKASARRLFLAKGFQENAAFTSFAESALDF